MGDGHTKNLRPRKVIERNTEKRGAPTDSKGTAQGETDPHRGIRQIEGRKQIDSGTRNKDYTAKKCNNAKKKCNSHTLTTKRMAIK